MVVWWHARRAQNSCGARVIASTSSIAPSRSHSIGSPVIGSTDAGLVAAQHRRRRAVRRTLVRDQVAHRPARAGRHRRVEAGAVGVPHERDHRGAEALEVAGQGELGGHPSSVTLRAAHGIRITRGGRTGS